MDLLDWGVLIATQVGIVLYGMYKSRKTDTMEGYLLGGRELKWFTIGLSIIATQASAITFLSTPGQAYGDGMRFVQFYFGMPLAMIFLSIVVVPIYHKLNVYTAYEYLEHRFDLKTRVLGAVLFLSQRSLAAGLSIYAPSIILSTVLGWNMYLTNLLIGLIVIFYTVSGGTKAVSYTQKQQMSVILIGMIIAFFYLVYALPENLNFGEAVSLATDIGKMNILDFSLDWNDRYTFWTGTLAGFFLFLSYFGTDQSQVQRYLGGKSIKESRMGLMMNGFVKVPMQFLILFVGVFLFLHYQFQGAPLHFNQVEVQQMKKVEPDKTQALLEETDKINKEKRLLLDSWKTSNDKKAFLESFNSLDQQAAENQKTAISFLYQDQTFSSDDEKRAVLTKARNKDRDYVFITFITSHLPKGLVGLLIAVILSAAMSSASSELNALGTTTTIDLYKRFNTKEKSDKEYVNASKLFTILWGVFAILFSLYASRLENLIQAVNNIGSWVYGTVLGIFLTAFFIKRVKGNAVFIAAITSEIIVISLANFSDISYLWYNVIGCGAVLLFALVLSLFLKEPLPPTK